ncbi:MAG: nucleotidyl transferase AbiEii/AbiGii toxin family protein [candidate division Zixibacteria bacterium]|nr:nucleotidyl transferase AbiEii/AbiGii toxin family protein [candidate division Zixibacteria bacterium]
MTNSFYDISGKIDKDIIKAISDMDEATQALDISYFIIGAFARDIINILYETKSIRATRDIDFIINVSGWDEYNALVNKLLSEYGYVFNRYQKNRLNSKTGKLVDIVPYGDIENPKYSIQWPNTGFVMSAMGFEEVNEACLTVLIRKNPDLKVTIPTPASLVILKFISWHEKYPARRKDAIDILQLINNYCEFETFDRFHTEHGDIIIDEDNYDFNCGFARLLGRDIASIIKPASFNVLLEILNHEIDDNSEYKLIRDMQTESTLESDEFDNILELVKSLRTGLIEKKQT